jgi:hypothetical protein
MTKQLQSMVIYEVVVVARMGGGCLFFYIQSFVHAARKGYCYSLWDLMLSNIKLGLVITAVNFEALECM